MKKTLADISKELNRQSGHQTLPGMIFITDQAAQPMPKNVIEKMSEGSLVILRDYNHENRFELAQALGYICRKKNIKFSVAGNPDLALAVQADGIHLPEYKICEAVDIRRQCPDYFITASCHNEKGILSLPEGIIDAVLLGPVFPTKSHPETFNDITLTIGAERFSEICKHNHQAIYALGGINRNTAEKLLGSGAAGIAAIRGF